MIDLETLQRLAALMPEQQPMQLAAGPTPAQLYQQGGYSSQGSVPKIDMEIIRQETGGGVPAQSLEAPVNPYKAGGSLHTLGGRQSLEVLLRRQNPGISDAEVKRRIDQWSRSSGQRVVQ